MLRKSSECSTGGADATKMKSDYENNATRKKIVMLDVISEST
jgi:hypothetical protein